MLALIVGLLRLAAFVICAIVIASFAIFAVDQTRGASNRQQAVIAGESTPPSSSVASGSSGASRSSGASGSRSSSTKHEGSVHKAIDEASNKLTSPFSAVTSGASSEWGSRGVKLLLALLVYGFGLGFLARVLRVRV